MGSRADAVMSGLVLDRHHEEAATLELFSRVVLAAGDEFLNRPDESPSLTTGREF